MSTTPNQPRPLSTKNVESVERVIPASADKIFDLLADPARHHDIDGSGTVQNSRSSAPDRLSLGSKFAMDMKMFVPYKMTNEVVEFVENDTIAWRHMGGHIWRYRLETLDGGTKITEEFDWRPSRAPFFLKLMNSPAQNGEAIEKTLERLAGIVDA